MTANLEGDHLRYQTVATSECSPGYIMQTKLQDGRGNVYTGLVIEMTKNNIKTQCSVKIIAAQKI